jgi:hypothetical protein
MSKWAVPPNRECFIDVVQSHADVFITYINQLLLVKVYGNKSLSFVRAKIGMRNYNEIGRQKMEPK